jgi:hypothetical protein
MLDPSDFFVPLRDFFKDVCALNKFVFFDGRSLLLVLILIFS